MLNSVEIYNKVDELRRRKGLTVNRLSFIAGISHGTLNAWRVRGTMPKLDVLENICYALDYSLVALLTGFDKNSLTVDEIELLTLWEKCNAEQKKAIITLLKNSVTLLNLSQNKG